MFIYSDIFPYTMIIDAHEDHVFGDPTGIDSIWHSRFSRDPSPATTRGYIPFPIAALLTQQTHRNIKYHATKPFVKNH